MAVIVREKQFYKTFFTLTLTIALQNLVVYGVNLADNIMLGAYSETAMSGVALVNQIQFFLQMLVVGSTEGITILASRSWGRREIKPIHGISQIGMVIALFLSALLWLVCLLFPTGILTLFTNELAVIEEGARYLRIVSFSYLFYAVSAVMISTLRSVETVNIGFIVSLFSLVVNIGLNYVLIFGKLGFPVLGVEGAAIATLLSRVVEVVVCVIYMKRFDKKLRMPMRAYFEKIDFSVMRSFLKVSWPVMMSGSIWGLAMSIQSAILGHMGQQAIAANSVASTVFSMITVVAYGSANATSVLIGKTIGEGRIDAVKLYAKTIQLLFLGIGICTGALMYICTDWILVLYKLAPDTLALARTFLIILSITCVGSAYQMPCLCGIVRGGGQTDFVLYNDLIFQWLIVLPSALLAAFVFDLSPVIVFICLKSDQVLKCFVAVVKVNRFRWIRILDKT